MSRCEHWLPHRHYTGFTVGRDREGELEHQKGRIALGVELAYAVLIFLFHAIYCIRTEDFSVDR